MGKQWSWETQRFERRGRVAFALVGDPSRRRPDRNGWRGAAAVIGVMLVGGVGGIGAGWWLAANDVRSAAPSVPIEWDAVQDVPRATLDHADAAWLERGREGPADGATSTGAASAPIRARFGLCHSGGGTNCVVDGDTLWVQGHSIRLADIDAPETHAPRCAAEQALGDRATRRLHALVNRGAVTLATIDSDRDRYGRWLRIVAVDGVSVGETLVGEGLARWFEGRRRSWC